jgi:hypothetical protein
VDPVDGHRPAVAGDVPVQLVERTFLPARKVEADRVGDAVADDDLPVGVARAGNIDLEPARPTAVFALLLYPERLSGRVGDRDAVDIELRRATLRGVVVERQVADDTVPLTREADGELLGDIERSVGVNGDQRIKVADAQASVRVLRARGIGEREKEE